MTSSWWIKARRSEFWLLWASLLLASLLLSSLNQVNSRLDQLLDAKASEFLAADLVVRSDKALPDSYAQMAEQLNLQQAPLQELMSMAGYGEHSQLLQLKAISPGYPLRGELKLADQQASSLQPGEIWLDNRLVQQWQLPLGAEIELGDRRFRLAGRVLSAPDQSFNFSSFVPYALIRLDDLPSTGLVTTGSRVNYRLLLAGSLDSVQAYRDWQHRTGERGIQLEGASGRQPVLQQNLDRARQVFNLTGLLGVVLASAVLTLASRSYLQQQQQAAALLRCLGASRRQLLAHFSKTLGWIVVLALIPGSLLGLEAAQWLSSKLAGALPKELPPVSIDAWLNTGLGLLLLLTGSLLPLLLKLQHTPPGLVLRDTNRPWPVSSYWSSLLALLLVLLLQNGFSQFSLIFIGLLFASLLLILGCYRLLRLLPVPAHWPAIRLTLNRIRRFKTLFLLQSAGLMLVLLCLLLLGRLTQDLVQDWQAQQQQQKPNSFLINLQPGQETTLYRIFDNSGLPRPELAPLYRARLSAINDQPIQRDQYQDARARRLAEREFNLSSQTELSPDNRIVAGDWSAAGFSVEQGLAETLGIQLGDRLSFDFSGQTLSAPVSSLRELHWDSMRLNFFVLASPGLLPEVGVSQVSSFHLPEAAAGHFDRQLQTSLPQASRIDIGQILKRITQLVDQLTQALTGLLGFALIAGLLLMVAALAVSQHERRQELALLRTLGADWRLLRNSMAWEALLLTLVCLGPAWLIAEALRFYLGADLKLNYRWQPQWLLWLLATVLPVVLIAHWSALKLLYRRSVRQLQS